MFVDPPPKHLVDAERAFSAHPEEQRSPAAENTEKLRGAFTPNVTVIVRAKVVRRAPLSSATMRVFQRSTRRRPKSVSATRRSSPTPGSSQPAKRVQHGGADSRRMGIACPTTRWAVHSMPQRLKPICDGRQERDPQSEA
mgnify:CR=1 FL=1